MGDPIKDALYYSVSEYERRLNPNITEDQVITKAAWARQNPEKYFAETYKKIKGTNIDEATINRVREISGIPLDITKLPSNEVNYVDNDKRELINYSKQLEEIQAEYGIDIEADDNQIKDYFTKKIYPNVVKNSRSFNMPSFDDMYKDFYSRKKQIKDRYNLVQDNYNKAYERVSGELDVVPMDKFFKDTQKITSGDVSKSNNAKEQRQNAFMDSERYFGILAEDFQRKQAAIADPFEQQVAASLINGQVPEIPEGFQPSKELKSFLKSMETLTKQRDINVSQFGSKIGKQKMTYNEQLQEYKSILQEDRDLTQGWITRGKDSYRGEKVPSVTGTWLNRAVFDMINGVKSLADASIENDLEEKARIALENNNYDEYLKLQRKMSQDDFLNDKTYARNTEVRTDVTAPIWEKYVNVDGHRIAVDSNGKVQRVVNNDGFTVHNLSNAEKQAISKYQANPTGYKVDEGFSKSWKGSLINMAGGSAVQMIPMIVGGMTTAPLRGMGVLGSTASTVVSSGAMFVPLYGTHFKEHFEKTGNWNESSVYATMMAGTESMAEWLGGRVEMKMADKFSGMPIRDIITGAGRRAADVALNARNIANFNFHKEFLKQLAVDIGQEEAEEIFTMFAQHAIDKGFGNDSQIDTNEVLSTVLVTPLATAPFSLMTNAANYKTPGAYRDMVNLAADNYEKTVDTFAEINASMIEGKSEPEKKRIIEESKKKLDLIRGVKERKDKYAGAVAFKDIDFEKDELEAIEHYIFEESLGDVNNKKVDYSKQISGIISKARKRGLKNAATEKEDDIIDDLEDEKNRQDLDLIKKEPDDIDDEEYNDAIGFEAKITNERMVSIADKIKNKQPLTEREQDLYDIYAKEIENIINGVSPESASVEGDENPVYVPGESTTSFDQEILERKNIDRDLKRKARELFVFEKNKDKDGFSSKKTINKDGSFETISNDFETMRNGKHSLYFGVDQTSAQALAMEAIDISRQTGIPVRIDVAQEDNMTDIPLKVSFNSNDDARTFYNLLKQGKTYNGIPSANVSRFVGHNVDDKVQYSSYNVKDISKAHNIVNNFEIDDEGNYIYTDGEDFIPFTSGEMDEFSQIVNSPKKDWENASVRQFSETVDRLQPSTIEGPGTDNRRNPIIDTLRNPEQIQTRKEEAGVEKLNASSDDTFLSAFDYSPGQRKEIDVYRNGKKGVLSVNEGGQVEFNTEGAVYEIGNINDFMNQRLKDQGFYIPSNLQVNKKNQIIIGGRVFINPYSHAEGAINLNEDGGIESVDIVEKITFTGQMIPRTFTGQQAIDIAVALVTNQVKFDEDYKTFFENYTPDYRDTRLIPSRITVDRLAQEIMPLFPGKPAMAMETAKMYFVVANKVSEKYPDRYPSPGQYIIDRVRSLDSNNVQSEVDTLLNFLEKVYADKSLSEDERENILSDIERIKRINTEVVQEIISNPELDNPIVREIKSLPLSHVSMDPEQGISGMGKNEMVGTYISTEPVNRYYTSQAIENGADIMDVKLNISNPYDLDKHEGDITELMQNYFKRAIGRYIYEYNLTSDMEELLKKAVSFDDDILYNFPGFNDILAQEITDDLVNQGYDSFYSRQNMYREGYVVVFDKSKVTMTPKTIFEKQEIVPFNEETMEDIENENAIEEAKLMSGVAVENRRKGYYVKNGIRYDRQAPIPGIYGKKGMVKFASYPEVIVPFRYKLIDVRQLIPSHINGRLNPMHFIPEAQPKRRGGKDSMLAVKGFAFNPRLNEIIIEGPYPYSGIPVVNKRGEVIQGNNRAEGIQAGYIMKNTTVRDGILENLEMFGFTPDQAETIGIDNVFIVRELDVNDEYAIELGNYEASDLETGSKRPINPVTLSNKIPYDRKELIIKTLFEDYDNQTLNELVRLKGREVFDIISPFLNTAIRNTIFSDNTLNATGIEGIENTIIQFLFEGNDSSLAEIFESFPATIRNGIINSLPFIFSVEREKSLLPDLQKAILGYADMINSGLPFDNWATQRDMFNSGFANQEIYTPLELKLIKILDSAKIQNDIVGKPDIKKDKTDVEGKNFFKYSLLARPKQEGLIFDDGVGGMSKKDAVFETFNVPYNEKQQKQESGQEEAPGINQPSQNEPRPKQDDVKGSTGGEVTNTSQDKRNEPVIDPSEYSEKDLALNGFNGNPGDIIYNQPGNEFEIISVDPETRIYSVIDSNGNIFDLNSDSDIWAIKGSSNRTENISAPTPEIVTPEQPQIDNIKNHPDFNVSTNTVVLTPSNDVKHTMGYNFRLDIQYPMNTLEVKHQKSYYFKENPSEEQVNDAIQKFIYDISESIDNKENTTTSDDKTMQSLTNLKDALKQRQKDKVSENKQENGIEPREAEIIPTVRDLANKGYEYITGAFFSSLNQGDTFTVDGKVYEVIRKTKEKSGKYENPRKPGVFIDYNEYSITIKQPDGPNIIGKSRDVWGWYSNSKQWGNLSRGIDGMITTDLINELNPFHEKSDVYRLVERYLNSLNAQVNYVDAQLGIQFPEESTPPAQPVVYSPEVIAENVGISPKTFKDLYLAAMQLFGLDRLKSFTSAIIMDRMVGVMANRSGVSKEQMYDKLRFEKANEEFIKGLSDRGKILFQIVGESAELAQNVKDNLEVAKKMDNEPILAYFEAFLSASEELDRLNEAQEFDETKRGKVVSDIHKMYYVMGYDPYKTDREVNRKFKDAYQQKNMDLLPERKGNLLIRRVTGWEKGSDGKWRYEIEDPEVIMSAKDIENLALTNSYVNLTDFIKSELFDLYPELKDAVVRFSDTDALGMHSMEKHPWTNKKVHTISLNISLAYSQADLKVKSTLLHEIQHAIQVIEGFPYGGSPEYMGLRDKLAKAGVSSVEELNQRIKELKEEYNRVYGEWYQKAFNSGRYKGQKAETSRLLRSWQEIEKELLDLSNYTYDYNAAYQEYRRLAGEVEARNVQNRILMSPEERRSRLLQETEDVAREEQIILFGGEYVKEAFDSKSNVQKVVPLLQKIKGKYMGAAMIAQDGSAVIYALTDPNVSTPLHEMAHVFEHYLTNSERKTINEWAMTDNWTTETSEKFARGFEMYLSEGVAPDPSLQKIFDKFKQWLTEIYTSIYGSGINVQLNDAMRDIYSKMIGTNTENFIPGNEISRRVVEMGSDQGGISDFTANRITEEDYIEQEVLIEDLLSSDPDLKSYIENTDEVRDFEGNPFEMYPIVSSKGEVIDGYNRIHQMINDGEEKITVYRGVPKNTETALQPKTSTDPLLAGLNVRGRLINDEALQELQKEIESNYAPDVMGSFGNQYDDIRTKAYNYDNPYAQKTINGVDIRIAEGLIRENESGVKEKTYLIYANGKIVGEFYSVDDAKKVVDFIGSNLVTDNKKTPQLPEKIEEPAKEYKYELRSRPFGIGTYPKNDNFVRFEDATPGDKRSFGFVVYNQPLTLQEWSGYELAPVTAMEELEGKEFQDDYYGLITVEKMQGNPSYFTMKMMQPLDNPESDFVNTEAISAKDFFERLEDGTYTEKGRVDPVEETQEDFVNPMDQIENGYARMLLELIDEKFKDLFGPQEEVIPILVQSYMRTMEERGNDIRSISNLEDYLLTFYPENERATLIPELRQRYTEMTSIESEKPNELNLTNTMSMFVENPVIADRVVEELGININEMIIFTDENGNPC